MGVISAIATLGGLIRPATDLTRVLRGDKHAGKTMDHEWRKAVLEQLSSEFARPPMGWFDRLVNGLNRLPRPALALGTLGLFVYAMADPVGFAARMQGLVLVPDQLWWLLGAIVSFYFGARELHHFRDKRPQVDLEDVMAVRETQEALGELRETPSTPLSTAAVWGRNPSDARVIDPDFNPALDDWRASREVG